MPELPDVERFRRILDPSGMRRRVAKVWVGDRRILAALTPQQFARKLSGVTFLKTRRHGKHLLVRHDGGGWLTLHFGMSGALACMAQGEKSPPYTRIRFDFADGGHLAYTSRRLLGRVGLADDADAFCRAHELGSDALDPAFDRRAFLARLAGTRRSVKAALMDQSLVAGIGNIYSDEILFQARLHPKVALAALDQAALTRLYRAMRRVLETAIARGAGSEELLDRLPRGYLLPRRRKGGRCPRCAVALTSLKAGGRTAWFCPRCQPQPRRPAKR